MLEVRHLAPSVGGVRRRGREDPMLGSRLVLESSRSRPRQARRRHGNAGALAVTSTEWDFGLPPEAREVLEVRVERRHGNALTSDLEARILELDSEGLSRVVIAERLQVHPNTVRNYLRRAGRVEPSRLSVFAPGSRPRHGDGRRRPRVAATVTARGFAPLRSIQPSRRPTSAPGRVPRGRGRNR